MSRTVKTLVTVSVLLNVLTLLWPLGQSSPEKGPLAVCIGKASVSFSPSGKCEDNLVKTIDRAHKTIRVLAYSFTSEPIAKALIRAHARGVYIEVILDGKSIHNQQCKADLLQSSGVNVWIDKSHPLAHNKTILIDNSIICTGSYNFSNQAELNAENSLVIDCQDLFARYLADYNEHREHSVDLDSIVLVDIKPAEPYQVEEF